MDRMRPLLAALGVLEAGLDRLSRAHDRVALRQFLKAHPDVRFPRYPDGG